MEKKCNALTNSDLMFAAMSVAALVLFALTMIFSHRAKVIETKANTLERKLHEAHDVMRRQNYEIDSLHSAAMFEDDQWWQLIEALIEVESNGRSDAVGDNGQAVGVLQIHPCVIDDLQVAGYDFTLDDRLDPDKSVNIFNAYQRIYNPARDIDRAIKLHNPRAGESYREKVIKRMGEARR